VRRIEVFTGARHRRVWSAKDKARIVAESYSGLEAVCAEATPAKPRRRRN
jgi:transposase